MRNNNSAASPAEAYSLEPTNGDGMRFSAEEHSDLLEALNRVEEERHHSNLVLSAVAHDMKGPVAIFTGYLKLLASEKVGLLNERQQEILQDMQVSCVRMQHLIAEFLTYGVIGAENRIVNFEANDLKACIDEVCRDWTPLCKVKTVNLEFSARPELPTVLFDYQKIKQAIACLVDNALKFTPSGKSIRMTLEPHFWERRFVAGSFAVERRKSSNVLPNSVLISVIDSGPGIPPEYQQEVFEEFYTRRCGEVQSSTGLGLAIARRVSQAHGGKIWVESTVGTGSKFCILLPLRPPIASSSSKSRGSRTRET